MTCRDRVVHDDSEKTPEYLHRWPGLYIRAGDRIVEAPPEDAAVARAYPSFPDKGQMVDGTRITILTNSLTKRPGDRVRVIHVVEFTEPGQNAYIMGPKPVFGEYINNELVTMPPPDGDPLTPTEYNGVTLPTPAIDYNFDITSYVFDTPGTYRIQWCLGSLESNTLVVSVLR